MKTIKIGRNSFVLQYTFRSLLMFEQLAGRPFEGADRLDTVTFFWCVLKANNPCFSFEPMPFIDFLENDLSLLRVFERWLHFECRLHSLFSDRSEEGKKKEAVKVSDLFAMIIARGIAPDYFLDKMQPYEVNALFSSEHIDAEYRTEWERTRQIVYAICQSQSTKPLKLTGIMPFPWDKDAKPQTSVSTAEMDRVKKQMQEYIKNKKDAT